MAPAPVARAPSAAAQRDSFGLQSSPAPGRAEGRGTAVAAFGLHGAARGGDLAQLERLLAQGAVINAPDETGKTPLMLAAIHGQGPMVRRLLALGANPSLVDRDGLNAAQHARRLGREALAREIEAGS
jgi:Meckel syndrome type 1 protein